MYLNRNNNIIFKYCFHNKNLKYGGDNMDKKDIIIIALAVIIILLAVIAGLAMDFKNDNQVNITNNTTNSSLNVEKIYNSSESSQSSSQSSSKSSSSSSSKDDDPFSQYSEDVQAQANHYKSTHNNHYSEGSVVAHEDLGDGNYRIYFGDGRNYVVSGE